MSAVAGAGNRPQLKFRGPDGVVRWLNKEVIADKAPESDFCQGDVVKMVPKFAALKSNSLQFSEMEDADRKFKEAVGTVKRVSGSNITAYFKGLNKRTWRCDSSNLVKLNKFSLNQLIRIRSDPTTLGEIEKQFKNQSVNLKGAIGHVTGVNRKDPSGNLLVQFDDSETYDWLLPSSWMEPFQSPNPSIDKERLELASKQVALFFRAVEVGDLRNAKLIHDHHGVDADVRNPEGKTALHLASKKGYQELIEWLLNEAKVDVDQPDSKGNRAIHFAILGRKLEILEILLEKGAEVDIRNNSGQTALHIAVAKKFTACFSKLSHHEADPNVQDADGNTALHIAILNGNDPVLNELTSIFEFQWELRNKKGLNIIHQAVMEKDFGTLRFILGKDDMCDPLLELLPNSQSTVLHHACANRIYTLAKLLVEEAKDWIMPDGLPLLGKLLEARNERGDTALLIACLHKDHAIVELLVESGADVKTVDQDGNTTILLAASSAVIDAIPVKENAPSIYKFYERALRKNHDMIEAMENHPILALIGYLISKGSCFEAANNDGENGTDALLNYGPVNVIMKMLSDLVLRSLNEANSGLRCMGRDGCNQPPIAHLNCPHKETYKACIGCFQHDLEEEKCGCPEEDVASVLYAFLELRELSRRSDAEETTTGTRPTGSKRKMSGKEGLVGQPPLKKK